MTQPQHDAPLPEEPAARRLRHTAFLAALSVLVVVCVVWLLASYHHQTRQADANAQAADRLCRQVTALGQPCATQAVPDGVATQAVVPLPAVSVSLTPVTPRPGATGAPTDEHGVPQAYEPGPDAQIVAISVAGAHRLILTYSDGARVDAGPVDVAALAIVLRNQSPPSPSPSAHSGEPMPPGDATPEPTWTSPPADFQPPGDLESETP